MTILDLFSGIGGFSLGLERAGMTTVAFCECDPYARKVLAKHWPDVPCFDDVKTLTAEKLREKGIGPIDLICGGFPCQDISFAGKGAGIAGERSGLWYEFARIIREVEPRYVIVENVSALLIRGLDAVLGTLAEIGYDAEWHCIPASYVGAPHRRDRVWIVGHAMRTYEVIHATESSSRDSVGESGGDVSDPTSGRLNEGSGLRRDRESSGRREPARCSEEIMADASRILEGRQEQRPERKPVGSSGESTEAGDGHWLTEPDVGRVAHGVPARVDRLRCLGNAVVPQIPELIGRAIMAESPKN